MAILQASKAPNEDTHYDFDAAVQRNWRSLLNLSSIALRIEKFLADSTFDRGPWLAVIFGAGVASWFILRSPWRWSAAIGAALIVAIAGLALRDEAIGDRQLSHLRQALIAGGVCFAAGLLIVWCRSELVGAEPIDRPRTEVVQG